jgi:catechol 2,3-dioxygenase-like lactoylglutathione lyase family enzyme
MPLELERLVDLYDGGRVSRRQLVQGIIALGIGPSVARAQAPTLQSAPLFRTRTLNHVTIYASDVAKSKAFYQRLTGLPVQSEDKESCEFRLENGFLGIYAPDPGQRFGFNHLCFGVEKYDPQTAVDAIRRGMPDAKPTLEGKQVFVQDPDGVRVQVDDVNYKR